MKIFYLILNGFKFSVSAALFEAILFDLNSCGKIVTFDYDGCIQYWFKPDKIDDPFMFGFVSEEV